MRLLFHIYCLAMVAALCAASAQDSAQPEAVSASGASAPLPTDWLPPDRVGRISLVSGDVDLRLSPAAWADAEVNQPIFAGESARTGPGARAEIRIGANTIYLSNSSQIDIASLGKGLTQILLARGRIGLHLRQSGGPEAVEIDVPQGGVWLLAPGSYDIELGEGDRPLRVAVFEGTAHFAGAVGEKRIEASQAAALLELGAINAASVEPASGDEFVGWCRNRDYDETRLVAPYYVSQNITGFAELDAAGVWKTNAQYGPVWFPTESADWTPYRFGHWSWIESWGWTWIDDRPWAFAPSHYGRWTLIDEHWAWVPPSYVARVSYAPAVVAFLGTPGIGLSSEEGATVAWFPLAPGEAYWPSYTRDLDYVRNLNLGTVQDVAAIALQADGKPPLEMFNEDFANRLSATAVPRSVFTNGRPVAPARVTLPERRLQNAPVLMGSPQIAPASTERVARAAPTIPPLARVTLRLPRKGSGKPAHTASIQSRGRTQSVILLGSHLRAPSYAGQSRSRQVVVLRVAHSRGSPGKKG
jgi:FecR protein